MISLWPPKFHSGGHDGAALDARNGQNRPPRVLVPAHDGRAAHARDQNT